MYKMHRVRKFDYNMAAAIATPIQQHIVRQSDNTPQSPYQDRPSLQQANVAPKRTNDALVDDYIYSQNTIFEEQSI